MKTLINYLKFHFGKSNNMGSYLRMRNDYIVNDSTIINRVSSINGKLNPKYNIGKSEGILGALSKTDVEKICSEIKEEGYFIFPGSLSKELITELRDFALNTPMHYFEVNNGAVGFTKDAVKYKDNKTLSNRYQILNISNLSASDAILKIVADENFLHIANEYLGTKPILDIITMWWSTCIGNVEESKREMLKGASAQLFHVDMDRLKFLKFFIYLTDVDTNTGPHVYVKKSHNKIPDYINMDGRYADELVCKHDMNNIVEITGKAGSIIAVDTRGLHKGKELTEGERLIFQVEFTNSLFGNPNMPEIPVKFNYKGNSKYFKSYKYFFTK